LGWVEYTKKRIGCQGKVSKRSWVCLGTFQRGAEDFCDRSAGKESHFFSQKVIGSNFLLSGRGVDAIRISSLKRPSRRRQLGKKTTNNFGLGQRSFPRGADRWLRPLRQKKSTTQKWSRGRKDQKIEQLPRGVEEQFPRKRSRKALPGGKSRWCSRRQPSRKYLSLG